MTEDHRRPYDVSDATVAAVGKVSEAVEYLGRCKGALLEFHLLSGHVDMLLQEAATELRDAGHGPQADELWRVIGRDVIPGHWTFEIVEEYEAGYEGSLRAVEKAVRDALVGGRPHLLEAEMKAREQRTAAELWPD